MKITFNVPKWATKISSTFGFGFTGGYNSAQTHSPRRGRLNGSNPRDQRMDLNGSSRMQIVKASREVNRNSGFAKDAVATMEMYAIGSGLKAQSQALEESASNEYEAYWKQFGLFPDLSNRFNIASLQLQMCRALDIDGELFLIKTFDRFKNPKVQILETHHISNHTDADKRIWDGIQYDKNGRVTFYHQLIPGKNGTITNKTKRIPARSVIHLFDPESPSAARGLPTGQHGLNALRDELELMSLENHAAKQNAEIGLVLKSNRPEAIAEADLGFDDSISDSTGTSAGELSKEIGARVVRIDETEDLESFKSERPNQMYQGQLEQLEREAAGGNLPYELIRNPSKVGGASVRLLTSKADRAFQARQEIIKRALDAMWVYVIGYGITNNFLTASKGWPTVRWQTPRKITVDAGREAMQARKDVESGLELISSHLAERGGEFDDWLDRRTKEARKIMNAAGHDESAPIPMWMIYKVDGMPIGEVATEPVE